MRVLPLVCLPAAPRIPSPDLSTTCKPKPKPSWLKAGRGSTARLPCPGPRVSLQAGWDCCRDQETGWWGIPSTTTSCPVLHNDLAPSYGNITQVTRSDMIQPFSIILLHKTTEQSSASSACRKRLTWVSPASRMPWPTFAANLVAYRRHDLKHFHGRNLPDYLGLSGSLSSQLIPRRRLLQNCSDPLPARLHNAHWKGNQQNRETHWQGNSSGRDTANMGCILIARPAFRWSILIWVCLQVMRLHCLAFLLPL